eukprot:s913_g20.t3
MSDCPLSLGICCMNSKLTGKPMQAILSRLRGCGDFELVEFEEEDILQKSVEEWPNVKCLIAFDSKGFPLQKCIEYCNLRLPTCINNVEAQIILESRVAVYNMLKDWCIPCPDHIIVEHDKVAPMGPNILQETDNFIVFNGKKVEKPFVEKPEDADRHDIYIYYPRNLGGGAKKLFRKVKDKSSEFDPKQNSIRRDGTYIYEPFLTTSGTDIKVYTCGASYVHAEARKAPTVDGKVIRSKDGKEVRYPVVLSHGEKMIAAFIVKAFRQNVCGFDILRTANGSYVCDVNGWSFVKGNQKYYNDCASLIRQHLLVECGVRASYATLHQVVDVQVTQTSLQKIDQNDKDAMASTLFPALMIGVGAGVICGVCLCGCVATVRWRKKCSSRNSLPSNLPTIHGHLEAGIKKTRRGATRASASEETGPVASRL